MSQYPTLSQVPAVSAGCSIKIRQPVAAFPCASLSLYHHSPALVNKHIPSIIHHPVITINDI
jgi:hypothetical protein